MINWKSCKPLTTEELDVTARKAVQGDHQAIELLVSSNVRLASAIAHEYRDFDGIHTDDLLSEALLGMIEAIPHFDPERGTKFTTYAQCHMRKRTLAFLRDNFRLVKIGTTQNQRKLFWRLARETKALEKKGIKATPEAIAERLNVKPREVQEMQVRMNASEESLNEPISDYPGHHNRGTLQDNLASSTPSPEVYTTERRMTLWAQARMIEFEQRLQDKELAIWTYRIASDDPLTLQEVGEKIGTSRQYVNQTEKRLKRDFIKYAKTHG